MCRNLKLFLCRLFTTVSRLQSHYEETIYFLPLSPLEVLVDPPPKDERLARPWSHPLVLNLGPLDWESSALTIRPLKNIPWKMPMEESIFSKNACWCHATSLKIISFYKITFQRLQSDLKFSFTILCAFGRAVLRSRITGCFWKHMFVFI